MRPWRLLGAGLLLPLTACSLTLDFDGLRSDVGGASGAGGAVAGASGSSGAGAGGSAAGAAQGGGGQAGKGAAGNGGASPGGAGQGGGGQSGGSAGAGQAGAGQAGAGQAGQAGAGQGGQAGAGQAGAAQAGQGGGGSPQAGMGGAGGGCAGTVCSGTCTDLQTDPSNCGVCGSSCGNALCKAGRCLPETVATFVVSAQPHSVVLKGGVAYVGLLNEANKPLLSQIVAMRTDTLQVLWSFPTQPGQPSWMTLAGDYLAWTVNGTPVPGPSYVQALLLPAMPSTTMPTGITVHSDNGGPFGITSIGNRLYWTNSTPVTGTPRSIGTGLVTTPHGATTFALPMGTDPTFPIGLGAAGQKLVVTDGVSRGVFLLDPATGSWSSLGDVGVGETGWAVVTDDTYAWVTARDKGSGSTHAGGLYRFRLDGGDMMAGGVKLYEGVNGTGIAITNDEIYWADRGLPMVVKNGIIAKLPLTTARAAPGIVPVQILATLEQDPVGLAVDDKHVYWCATGVDELRRVPKLP